MKKPLSLENMVNRIKFDEEMLNIHPEQEETLKKHIKKQKEYLVQCVMRNIGNPLLSQITM